MPAPALVASAERRLDRSLHPDISEHLATCRVERREHASARAVARGGQPGDAGEVAVAARRRDRRRRRPELRGVGARDGRRAGGHGGVDIGLHAEHCEQVAAGSLHRDQGIGARHRAGGREPVGARGRRVGAARRRRRREVGRELRAERGGACGRRDPLDSWETSAPSLCLPMCVSRLSCPFRFGWLARWLCANDSVCLFVYLRPDPFSLHTTLFVSLFLAKKPVLLHTTPFVSVYSSDLTLSLCIRLCLSLCVYQP